MGLLKVGSVLNSLSITFHTTFLEGIVHLSLTGLVNVKCPEALVLKLSFQETRQQHFWLPNSGYLGNERLRESPAAGF